MQECLNIGFMWEKTIVAYLDVLGYNNLVAERIGDPKAIEFLETMFYRSSVAAIKQLARIDLEAIAKEPDKEIQDYFKRVVETIRVRCIADSFIFTLPISEVNFSCSAFDQRATVGNCIETFFSSMTMFIMLFTSYSFGHLLRGGISIGRHYESEREGQIFVFSEAHNKSCELEKNVAHTPRIIIDAPLLKYLKEIDYPQDRFFYRDDEDGYLCLDPYKNLKIFGKMEAVLQRIKEGAIHQLRESCDNKKNLSKLIHFGRYHNRWIETLKLPALAVEELNKYEERLRVLKKQKPKKR